MEEWGPDGRIVPGAPVHSAFVRRKQRLDSGVTASRRARAVPSAGAAPGRGAPHPPHRRRDDRRHRAPRGAAGARIGPARRDRDSSPADRRPIRRRGSPLSASASISSRASAQPTSGPKPPDSSTSGVRPILPATRSVRPAGSSRSIDPNGERSFFTDRGANEALSAADIPDALIARRLDDPSVRLFVLRPLPARGRARRHAPRGRKAGQRRPGLGRIFARGRAGAISLNGRAARRSCSRTSEEAAVLAGSDDPETQCARLAALYPLVVIKRGAVGCEAAEGARRWQVDGAQGRSGRHDRRGRRLRRRLPRGASQGRGDQAALERAAAAGAAAATSVGGRPRGDIVRPV